MLVLADDDVVVHRDAGRVCRRPRAKIHERLRTVAKGNSNFIEQARLFTAVARRKMEGLDTPHARLPRNFSGGRGRQMRPLGR